MNKALHPRDRSSADGDCVRFYPNQLEGIQESYNCKPKTKWKETSALNRRKQIWTDSQNQTKRIYKTYIRINVDRKTIKEENNMRMLQFCE